MDDPYSIYPDPVYDIKVGHDDHKLWISEGFRTLEHERANHFATKVYDTREKAVRDALIAMGWIPPKDIADANA